MQAERKGLAGMVIDGNCRDTPMTRSFDIPLYSRGYHPNAGTVLDGHKVMSSAEMG